MSALQLALWVAAAQIAAPPTPEWIGMLEERVWDSAAPLGEGAYRMTCELEYLDGEERVTKRLVLEHRVSFAGGELRQELLSALEDGRDVTEREREKQGEGNDGDDPREWILDETLEPPLPFLWSGGGYRLEVRRVGAVSRIHYHRDAGGEGARGAAGWVELDTSDGLPVLHQFSPDPLPRRIRTLTTLVRYGRLRGFAVPEATESRGEGGFLFIKRRFRVRMTYHDWQLRVAEP